MARMFKLGGKSSATEEQARLAAQKEEDDLKRAIEASMKETSTPKAAAYTSPAKPKVDPNVVSNDQEQDDIAKAIAESMKDSNAMKAAKVAERRERQGSTSAPSAASSLYPNFDMMNSASSNGTVSNPVAKELIKVRALYDFEAAEDNELTFKAGEIIHVSDNA